MLGPTSSCERCRVFRRRGLHDRLRVVGARNHFAGVDLGGRERIILHRDETNGDRRALRLGLRLVTRNQYGRDDGQLGNGPKHARQGSFEHERNVWMGA